MYYKITSGECPVHGPVHAEATGFPFTITKEAYEFAIKYGVMRCVMRGCESEIELMLEETDILSVQHFVVYEDEGFLRVIKEVSQIIPGVYAEGIALEKYGPEYHYLNA